MHEEEVQTFPNWYIKFPVGHALRLNREMRGAFQVYFCDALKQVSRNKLPGLDGLPHEVYLRMSHMFVPILTDMFHHWFAYGVIPGSITKGGITLLKKGGTHLWEDLDDYRPITLLNTELKILARVLANHLQLVISDLSGPEQNCAVKGRLIQDNLHLVCKILVGLKDDTEAMLIDLNQFKAFNRVDHQFLATVLETARFKLKFHKWISMLYHNLQTVVHVIRKHLEVFAVERLVQQDCPLSSLWSPSSVGLGIRRLIQLCVKSPLPTVSGQRSLHMSSST